jgi:hypothetical protein
MERDRKYWAYDIEDPPPRRQGRTHARRPGKYHLSDNDLMRLEDMHGAFSIVLTPKDVGKYLHHSY